MTKAYVAIFSILTVSAAHSATINWGAQVDTGLVGIVNANGTAAVASGDLIRLGYFTVSNSIVQANKSNLSVLSADWVSLADAHIGDGTGYDGTFASVATPTLTAGEFSHQLYVWALNAPTVTAATQQAIFYEPSSSNANWVAPGSNISQTTIDIGDAKTSLGGVYLAGSYQYPNASITSIFNSAGAPGTYGAIQLESVAPTPVPEPSTFAVGVLAAFAAAGVRRRRE